MQFSTRAVIEYYRIFDYLNKSDFEYSNLIFERIPAMGSSPNVDTVRGVVDCATTLMLEVFRQRNLEADF